MNKGFTLIELLVVIAIIGILASIIFVAVPDIKPRCERFKFQDCQYSCGSSYEENVDNCLKKCDIRAETCESWDNYEKIIK